MNRERSSESSLPELRLVSILSAAAVALLAGCGLADDGEPLKNLDLDYDTRVQIQELSSFCSVQVLGYGAVDVENDYLPSVIACENGNAPMEALKAQAVAARTYAMFITEAENRPLAPTTADQVYDCDYASVEQRHIDAVQETAGQVLTHGDQLLASFYVAGAIPSSSTCRATSSDSDPTGTEQFVTYNEGRIGGQVQPTSLGHPANPANRGAKSQNGATCLADEGWDYQRILRFYYGDDARARVAEESQCAGEAPDGGAPPPGTGDDVCNIAPSTASTTPACMDPSQAPKILPRSSWNARAPKGNRPHHSPNRISVHHTVTPNEAADGAHWVNQIQLWHMNQGWSDIGYHFLISWDGTIYRGNPENRMGAHVGNDNSGNLGIALIGRYDQSVAPSDAQMKSLAQMLRYLGDKYGIDLSRNTVKGHGEWPGQSTACPGTHLRNQLDDVVGVARSDATCGEPDSGADSGAPDVDSYRYVRVRGLSNEPTAENDVVDGFEVDSIYFERSGTVMNASAVLCSPGVSNPGAALGDPDNLSCDDRLQTVAGVPEGADLVVELDEPMEEGDILFVTQHSYQPAMANCEPTGTAQISVSNDGRIWKVLDDGAQGNWRKTLDSSDFVFDEYDETADKDVGFEFITPRAGQAYTPDVTFKVKTNHPEIVEVEYYVPDHAEDVINEDWTIGTSTNRSNNYEVFYEIQYHGERVIAASGIDAQGNEVVSQEITITVTDYDGNVPEGQGQDTDFGPGTDYDSAMGALLAEEAGKCYDPSSGGPRCQSGSGGFSTGHCWRFVKRALERAGISWAYLDSTGPCTTYRFHLSAYGFRCNADPNPSRLAQIGLQRVSIPPTEAPAGAVIAWGRGCAGYHAEHGHIEISQGDGTACSDYCGNIRSGGQSCASVYVPVN